MNKRILHRAAGFLLAVVLVLGLAVPAFATTQEDAILAQMAANSAAWHTADAEGRKQLEAANQALRAELASLGNNNVSYNPATGVTAVTSKTTGSQVYSNTTVKDTSGNKTSTQTWVTSSGSTVTQTSNAGAGTIYANRDNITSVGTDIKVTVTDQNGNVVTKNDTIYTTKGYDQNYTVITQSNATTEAVNWCKQNGVPVNEQNVAAYISEHYWLGIEKDAMEYLESVLETNDYQFLAQAVAAWEDYAELTKDMELCLQSDTGSFDVTWVEQMYEERVKAEIITILSYQYSIESNSQ